MTGKMWVPMSTELLTKQMKHSVLVINLKDQLIVAGKKKIREISILYIFQKKNRENKIYILRPDCDWNEIKIPDTEDQCCWHCLDCGKYKMRMSEYECKKCDDGWKSEQNQTDNTVHCVLIEEV